MFNYKQEMAQAEAITKGVLRQVLIATFTLIFWALLIAGFLNLFNIGIDPTDLSGWKRSGLAYYKDHGTGVEYVGTRHGGLMIRETGDE